MYPIIFQIGSFSLRSYGLMAALGFLSAVGVIMLNRKYAKMTADQVSTLVFISIVTGIIGARLFYVVQFWQQYRNNWAAIIRIDQGGLVYYGGFLLTLLAIWIYCRKQELDVLRVMDICAPGLALGHAFGRLGCFLNGCCFGHPGGGALSCHYPAGSAPFVKFGEVGLHPVQLYEAAMNLLLFPLLFLLVRKTGRGVPTSAYLILYGTIRFIDEFFRGDHRNAGGLTEAQIIGLLLLPCGIALLIYSLRRNHHAKPETEC